MPDGKQDCLDQYRDFITEGKPHAYAIKHVEFRIGQNEAYRIEFRKALKALSGNVQLRRWWRDYHAPFEIMSPRPKKPAQPLLKKPKKTPEEKREASRLRSRRNYLKRKAQKHAQKNPDA